jgi:hypothetical protein
MDLANFWELIDKTRSTSDGDPAKQSELLIIELARRSPEDIIAFMTIHYDLFCESYNADLWDAAYVINCGCSDDGFMDFRDWLIGRGEKVFRDAIVDPESLVHVVKSWDENLYPTLSGVEDEAYERATGHEMPMVYRDSPKLIGETHVESENLTRFPKLAARYFQPCLDYYNGLSNS